MNKLKFYEKIETLLERGYQITRATGHDLNCNNLVETGIYEGDDIKNAPTFGAGKIIVTRYSKSWIVQEYLGIGDRIFLRSYSYNKWTRWQEIYEEGGEENDSCEAEHDRLDAKIDHFVEGFNAKYYDLLQEINALQNKTFTGYDIVVKVGRKQVSLQYAIDNGMFCKCGDTTPPICISSIIGGFIIGTTEIGKMCDPSENTALCGTFKSNDVMSGEGMK